jgi:hypothetical protein
MYRQLAMCISNDWGMRVDLARKAVTWSEHSRLGWDGPSSHYPGKLVGCVPFLPTFRQQRVQGSATGVVCRNLLQVCLLSQLVRRNPPLHIAVSEHLSLGLKFCYKLQCWVFLEPGCEHLGSA